MATFYVDGITYTIIFSTNVSVTSSISGISRTNLFLDFVTDPATSIVYTITKIENNAFNTRPGLTGNLTIGASVTSIGYYAFFNCLGLHGTLTFSGPSSLVTIGFQAFYHCSFLTGSLAIPATVTSIGNNAFDSCTGLNGTLMFDAPSLLKSIGDNAFLFCNISGSITIPDGVTYIGYQAFNNCSLISNYIFLGNAPTTFGNNIFDGASTPLPTITYTSGTSGWPTTEPFLWPSSPQYEGTRLPVIPSAPSAPSAHVGYASFNVFRTNFSGMGNLGDYY